MSDVQTLASGTQPTPKILIVDDDALMLASLRLLLKAHGHSVESAQGGAKALELMQASAYDLMLLDLQMPDVGGHEILVHIRDNKIDTKVIVVSGETTFTTVKDALLEGAYDFVRKPYDAGELLTTIDNGLQRRTLERQHQAMGLALEESEKLHRYIVNNSPDIVYVLDRRGHFTFINDRIEVLLGYKREELIGKHYSLLVHEEDLAEANYVFHERRTGARASKDVELRLKVTTKPRRRAVSRPMSCRLRCIPWGCTTRRG